ncbi:MAG: hypothetical protein E6J62_20860 [Deltaproteobacteria bacterium]|nr:MAG: hypothetical protein E6J62_20860 [Deltaproteobacteria bacterium]
MREFFHRLLQRLHDEARPLSRNKHFHALSDGDGRRALRADRHLRDLEEHLEALRQQGQRPRVRRLPDGGVQLVLSHPRLALARTATLSAEEARLLAGRPAGAWALREEAEAAEAQPVVSLGTRTP